MKSITSAGRFYDDNINPLVAGMEKAKADDSLYIIRKNREKDIAEFLETCSEDMDEKLYHWSKTHTTYKIPAGSYDLDGVDPGLNDASAILFSSESFLRFLNEREIRILFSKERKCIHFSKHNKCDCSNYDIRKFVEFMVSKAKSHIETNQ